MRYLNALSPKLVASDLTVVASLDGPDILPVPKGYKKQMAEPHILEPCVTYESGEVQWNPQGPAVWSCQTQ